MLSNCLRISHLNMENQKGKFMAVMSWMHSPHVGGVPYVLTILLKARTQQNDKQTPINYLFCANIQ